MPASSPTTATGRESTRRSSKTGGGFDTQRFERREKAKSSQSYTGHHGRRGSRQDSNTAVSSGTAAEETNGGGSGGVAERPRVKARTNSAPGPPQSKGVVIGQHGGRDAHTPIVAAGLSQQHPQARPGAQSAVVEEGEDEDEISGVVGKIRQYQPFQNPEVWPDTSHVQATARSCENRS